MKMMAQEYFKSYIGSITIENIRKILNFSFWCSLNVITLCCILFMLQTQGFQKTKIDFQKASVLFYGVMIGVSLMLLVFVIYFVLGCLLIRELKKDRNMVDSKILLNFTKNIFIDYGWLIIIFGYACRSMWDNGIFCIILTIILVIFFYSG